MAQEKLQALIDGLMEEIQELRDDNERVKAKNRKLGGTGGAGATIQQRTCINCHRRLPDGPVYFPGYFEEPSADLATEAYRHHCTYCRGDSQ